MSSGPNGSPSGRPAAAPVTRVGLFVHSPLRPRSAAGAPSRLHLQPGATPVSEATHSAMSARSCPCVVRVNSHCSGRGGCCQLLECAAPQRRVVRLSRRVAPASRGDCSSVCHPVQCAVITPPPEHLVLHVVPVTVASRCRRVPRTYPNLGLSSDSASSGRLDVTPACRRRRQGP